LGALRWHRQSCRWRGLARMKEQGNGRESIQVMKFLYEIPLNSSPSIVVGAKMAPLNSKLAPTFWAVLKCLQIWQMADTGWLRLGGQFRKLLWYFLKIWHFLIDWKLFYEISFWKSVNQVMPLNSMLMVILLKKTCYHGMVWAKEGRFFEKPIFIR